jgi:hypothetical protein
MLNNPISQIERTKDAYAGNMQGLQKRANMTKELVDLLAMQQLKQDLDAIKRDQMMQQQGNPATIKDQMQQGLMGEYRQQAAKEMGVGPSEMGTVARAQQGMPQGAPQQQARMPQGMPQGAPQQPQMAQGVMSQARPVQLAGGGIVAFQEGGPTKDELANFLRAAAEKRRASEPSLSSIEQTPRQREMQELIARLAERRGNPSLAGTKTEIQERRRSRALQEEMEEMFTPITGGIQVGQMPRPDRSALRSSTQAGDVIEQQLTPREDTPGSGIMIQGIPQTTVSDAAITTTDADAGAGAGEGIMSLDDRIKTSLLKNLERDPSKLAKERAEAVRGELGLGRGIEILEDREARARKLYEERTDPELVRRRALLAQLGGLASGPPGSGSKARAEYRKEQEAVRDKFETALDNIGTAEMTLRREVGNDAADAYDAVMQREMTSIANAQGTLQRMSAEERRAVEAERATADRKAALLLQREGIIAGTYADPEKARAAASVSGKTLEVIRERIRTELGISPLAFQALRAKISEGGKEGERAKAELDRLEASVDEKMLTDPQAIAERRRQFMITKDLNEATAARAAQRQRLTGDTITVDAAGNQI